MNKRSQIHPNLKAAISSLELDLEAEIARYQNNKSQQVQTAAITPEYLPVESNLTPSITPENKEIELWHNQVVNASTVELPDNFLSVFKQPLGIASVLITGIASSLLGLSLNTPIEGKTDNQQSESLNPPEIVEGLNLATQDVELNLRTLATLNKPEANIVTKAPTNYTTNHQQQSSNLMNKLLPDTFLESQPE
jgi:hypothetical protein